jgi:CubicO group peptidase (beta-lactamase class C family)
MWSTPSEVTKIELVEVVIDSVPEIAEVPIVVVKRFAESETQQVRKKLDSLLKRIHKRHDFNGSLLVAKAGKIMYSNQVGYADFRKKKLLDICDAFQLASVSKQFTAAAIMILYERDLIRLSDTVNNYFPGFPYKGVTIQHLLNHTAGLPKYFWVAEHKWEHKNAPTNSEMMELLEASNVQRFFRSGRNFDYSNTGYVVLASIIEKVSGLRFGDFIEQNIFDPLGMDDSFVYSYENDAIKEHQLIGYRLYKGWRHLKINGTVNDAIVGDKNVYATTEDLFKWVEGLNSGKLLSKESLDKMYTHGQTKYGRKVPYGFGFRLTKDKEKIYHYGKWNGFSTGIIQYMKDDLVVIVLEHSSYTSMSYLNNKVKKIVSENFGV